MPFERVMPPLADGLPDRALWPSVILVAVLAATVFVAVWRTGEPAQGFVALLCAGAVGCAVIAALGDAAWLLFPDRMPDIVPLNAGPPPVRHALSRMEAQDAYVAAIVWGGLLVAVLAAVIRPVTRRRTAALRTLTFAFAALTSVAAAAGGKSEAVLAALAAIVCGMLTPATAARAGLPDRPASTAAGD
ncbi:hypothetical protein ACFFWE_10425 [Sphaerisporangium melleum]|nr:hypothetical protein [Sphaerisporangium melleum]